MTLTPAGEAEHAEIEGRTDAAAAAPWTALGEEDTQRLAALLEPIAGTIVDTGALHPRNPVGLSRWTASRGQ